MIADQITCEIQVAIVNENVELMAGFNYVAENVACIVELLMVIFCVDVVVAKSPLLNVGRHVKSASHIRTVEPFCCGGRRVAGKAAVRVGAERVLHGVCRQLRERAARWLQSARCLLPCEEALATAALANVTRAENNRLLLVAVLVYVVHVESKKQSLSLHKNFLGRRRQLTFRPSRTPPVQQPRISRHNRCQA